MKKVTLRIEGMHCTSCAMNIDGELEDLGVTNVQTNYAKGETKVEFDETKISIDSIVKSIHNLGYTTKTATT